MGCVLLAAACLLFVWRNGQVQKTRYGADYTAAGYQAARGAGRYTPVSLRQAVGDTELTIEEIYADRKQVCIRYTVSDGAAPLSGDPSSYLLAGRCRIEIDGVPYEKVQDTRTGAAVENGRYEASLLLDAADYPADFSFSETPRLVLTVTDYPGLQGETALEDGAAYTVLVNGRPLFESVY